MIAPQQQYRSLAIAGVVVAAAAVLLLAWTYHTLGDGRYGGVATIDETISRRMEQPAPEITSEVEVAQTFIASDNDLTEIQVFTGTYMRTNTVSLVFTLTDSAGTEIAESEANPRTIIDNAYYPFEFDRIPDSRGKAYQLTVSSPTGRPDNAFTVWTSKCDCYQDGELSISGTPLPDRELVMRVKYHHDDVVTWRELLDRMSQYKPLIFKGVGLVMLVMLGATFSLAALGAFTLSVVPRGEDKAGHYAQPLWIAAAAIVAVIVLWITGAYEGI